MIVGCARADALAISQMVDLVEIGLPPDAGTTVAGYFGNSNTVESEPELEPEPERKEPELEEPEPESPPGPMAEFDEAAVLAWVAGVPGLTAAQRAAALERMEEDEYDGTELAVAKAKSLLRLLRGTPAEGAVTRLLAARDTQLEAEADEAAAVAAAEAMAAAAVQQAAAEPAERPSCAICMEAYSAAGGVVPRMLVACGHAFCEACLDRMLRCAGHNRASPCRLWHTRLVPARVTGSGWRAGRCRRAGLGSGWSARSAGRDARSRVGARRSCRSCTTFTGRSDKRLCLYKRRVLNTIIAAARFLSCRAHCSLCASLANLA